MLVSDHSSYNINVGNGQNFKKMWLCSEGKVISNREGQGLMAVLNREVQDSVQLGFSRLVK
jgi:hypothetical protein